MRNSFIVSVTRTTRKSGIWVFVVISNLYGLNLHPDYLQLTILFSYFNTAVICKSLILKGNICDQCANNQVKQPKKMSHLDYLKAQIDKILVRNMLTGHIGGCTLHISDVLITG